MATSARQSIADFWDDVLASWIAGETYPSDDLGRWLASYEGIGKGQVDLSHYPDPYVGDLRGLRGEPRLVLLGLNPGIGYDQLQGANGKWTQRIAEVGYSHCFDRSPEDDLASWIELHGKRSPYWVKIVYFAQRWLDDTAATARDIFNIELFPWHSPSKNSAMSVPADIIQRYVWAPIGELPVSEVFGFGVDWFRVCEHAGLPRVALFGHGGQPSPALPINKAKWRIGMYRLPSGQIVIASAQSGSSNPPGLERSRFFDRWWRPCSSSEL